MRLAAQHRPIRSLRLINLTLLAALCGLGIVMLSGCSAQPMHTSANAVTPPTMAERKAAEERAWSRVGKLSGSRCGVQARPPEKSSAVAQSACVSDIVWQEVIPNAAFPNLVRASRDQAMKLANDYASGKITPLEYQQKSVARLRDYKNQWGMLAAQSNMGFVEYAKAKPAIAGKLTATPNERLAQN